MRDIEQLAQNIRALVNGWSERVEYKARNDINGAVEVKVKRVRHPALLVQLEYASRVLSSTSGQVVHVAHKPGSRPPGNPAALHLIDTIIEEARYHYLDLSVASRGKRPQIAKSIPDVMHNLIELCVLVYPDNREMVSDIRKASSSWVRKSRVLLGYEKPHIVLRDVVCGTCGGTLVVAADASTDVRCIGTNTEPSCGQVYARYTWLDLLQDQDRSE